MVTKNVTVGESELELFYHNSINYKILLHILYTGVEQPTLSLFPMNRDGQCSGKLKKIIREELVNVWQKHLILKSL